MDPCKSFSKDVDGLQGELDEYWDRDLQRVTEQTNSTGLRKSSVLKIPAGRLLGGSIVYAGPVLACPRHLRVPAARGTVLGSGRSGAPSAGSADTGFCSSACDICPLLPPEMGLTRPLQQPLHKLCSENTPCPPLPLLGGGSGGRCRPLPARRSGRAGRETAVRGSRVVLGTMRACGQ